MPSKTWHMPAKAQRRGSPAARPRKHVGWSNGLPARLQGSSDEIGREHLEEFVLPVPTSEMQETTARSTRVRITGTSASHDPSACPVQLQGGEEGGARGREGHR